MFKNRNLWLLLYQLGYKQGAIHFKNVFSEKLANLMDGKILRMQILTIYNYHNNGEDCSRCSSE